MEDLHLFYVESNFHLLLAENIISNNNIDVNHVLFVTHRGVKLPAIYKGNLLYDGTISQFKERVNMYKNDKKHYKELLNNKRIRSYSPFQYLYPSVHFFFEYNLMEEGFSAYSIPQKIRKTKALRYEFFKALYIMLMFPFANRNIKGFLMGLSYSSGTASRHIKLLVSNNNAYSNYDFGDKIEKILIPISIDRKNSPIRDNSILVMDRLCKKGRPFDDNTYLSVLKDALYKLGYSNQSLLVKLHPADSSTDVNVKERVTCSLGEIGIIPTFIDDNLEEIALSNNNNTFIGTNSTTLYYAPIFGRTNKSISFFRLLAKVDKQYFQFLEGWGGVGKFCEIFSKQVECL